MYTIPKEGAGPPGGNGIGGQEKMPHPSLGSGFEGVKMSSHTLLNCGCHNPVHHAK